MSQRSKHLSRILDHQAKREQLCQRRLAICSRAIGATEARLAELQQQQQALYRAETAAPTVTIQWHQHRQRRLDRLHRRLAKTQRMHTRLEERAQRRQTELVTAAQLRRATETALTRLAQAVSRTARHTQAKQLDNLVRAKRISQRRNSHAITA